MRRSAIIFIVVILLLLGCLLWMSVRSHERDRSLAVVFVGWTNNPQHTFSPFRVEVVPQGATGLCALFRVTNVRRSGYILFSTSSVETNDGRGWTAFVPAGSWSGVGGSTWTPGYTCLYAVGWPPGLPTNSSWRLQLSVAREPSGFYRYANEKL